MNKEIPKIFYDKESKVLSVEIQKIRSVDSEIHGNVVIDYDKNGNVVRINLYNFSFESFRNNLKALKSFSNGLNAPLQVK